jgi:hypothetical protein
MQEKVATRGSVERPASNKRAGVRKGKTPRAIYVLAQWTVERRNRGWFIIAAHDHVAGKTRWRGPYSSIGSACLAISKKLAREARQRHERHCAFHGIEDVAAKREAAVPSVSSAPAAGARMVGRRFPETEDSHEK